MGDLQLFAGESFDPGANAGIVHYPQTGQSLRWVRIDGIVWLHFGDLCKGTGHSNPSAAINLVEDEDKKKIDMRSVTAGHSALSFLRAGPTSGNAETWFVTEDGFVTLGLAGRGDGPRMFRRWVVKIVIPQFRSQKTPELSRKDMARFWYEAEERAEVLAAENAELRPKADYVDSFVNGDQDASTFRVVANQLKIGEKELRSLLIKHEVIYRKLEGNRWSRSQGRMVAEYSWHAYSTHKAWLTERDQPEAPRYRNGQMRTTLYVTPVGKVKVAELVRSRGVA